MTQNIPPDLLPRARQILLPLVTTVSEREALLTEAFWDDPLLHGITFEGAADVFATRLISKLIGFGYLPTGEHSLARLLQTARGHFGPDKHSEIDELIGLAQTLGQPAAPSIVSRELELDYLAGLKQNELIHIDRYTPISGGSQQQRRARMRVVCSLEPSGKDAQPKPFVDAVKEIPRIRRAVLLGEPGGGKLLIWLRNSKVLLRSG